MSSSPSFEVALTGLVYGGEAMGRLPDGRAVFVPYALPEEQVLVRLIEDRPRFARAELLQILTPGADRVQPRCQHYTLCGGCHYQHLPYERHLTYKADILREQLERIGGMHNPPVQPTIGCPQPWNYRNHIQFHLADEGRLGYYQSRSEQVFAIQECHLPEGILNDIWPRLEFEPVPGIERIGLRVGAGEDVQLILTSSLLEIPEISIEELPISAVHLSPAGAVVMAGSAFTMMQVLGRSFRVSASSFFQVNTLMAAALVEHILEHLDLSSKTTVLDVYCGVGLFSAFLAPQVGRLIGIEASPAACEDFVFNLDEFEHVELYEAPAEAVLPILDVSPDIVLVDPPRTGLNRKCLDAILAIQPSRLVYVSCDPATLARDARRLVKGGYTLNQITPFDLFPQTYHIESISFWDSTPH